MVHRQAQHFQRTIMRLLIPAVLTLVIGAPAFAQDRDHVRPRASFPSGARATPVPPAYSPRQPAAATAQEAEAFVAETEARLTELGEHGNHLGWVGATYINDDTNWLQAKYGAEMATLSIVLAKAAARFDGVAVDPVVRRKLDILKKS